MKASSLTRLAAFVFDYLIVYFIIVIIVSGSVSNNNFTNNIDSLNKKYSDNEISINEYTDKLLKINYNNQKNNISINILSTIIYIGYYIVFVYLNDGKTLGKKIFKIKVVNKNDGKLSIKNIILRSLFIYGIVTNLFNIIFVNLINYKYYSYGNIIITYLEIIIITICAFMILYRKDGRGLHDLIAGTYVIREEKR